MKAVQLKTEMLTNPIGIDLVMPTFSWCCEGGNAQTAYEIEARCGDTLFWNSKKVQTNKMLALLGVPAQSRQRIVWRVRLWDEANQAGAWSEDSFFEMGILDAAQFTAKWINPELTCDPAVHKPASYLKSSFTAPALQKARLYITAHGLYEAYLNGERVGNFVLAPGSDSYGKRMPYQTYDVTHLVKTGYNDVQVILGDGWYRSCSGVDGDRNLYGENIALLFQLEADGVPICNSDENWQATQMGPLVENDMQQGEVYDARKEELTGWHAVKTEIFPVDTLVCTNSLPITEQEHFPGKLFVAPNGEILIDYGQNLAGYITFTVDAHEGDTLVLTHGETLDENGNFTTENFQDRKRHKEGGTKQRVIYTCKEGVNVYHAKFTIWGFRYAKVETDIDLSKAQFTSIAVYSDMQQTGYFNCSDEDVNRLVQNSLWSMKSNFCDVPTDCPTRERAAWTGDIGLYIETGLFFADCYPVVRKWLSACRAEQYEDGKVANIAPRNNLPSFFTQLLAGSVGWGDACIFVPYALYRRSGDVRVLKENYKMMQRWYAYLEQRASQKGEAPLLPKENPYAGFVIESGVDYGEWCEPDVVSVESMKKPQYKVATAYFAYSGRLLAEIATLLNKPQDAAHYSSVCENAKQAFYLVATDHGKIVSNRQAEYVRAISFGLLSEEESISAAADLNRLIIQNGFHLNTGFLTTPALCSVLTQYGYTETAYRLLLQDTRPSWLYAVKRDATTIWENWDGIDENGVPKGSLNHYSYGSVCGWLFADVCGIHVKNGAVCLTPHPCKLLGFAEARYQSPIGEIVSAWRYEGEKCLYEFTIPSNGTAEVVLPGGEKATLSAGTHRF